jgi:hypothetical protein
MNCGKTWLQLAFIYVPDRDVIWNGPSIEETNTRDTNWRNEMLVIRPEPLDIVKQD